MFSSSLSDTDNNPFSYTNETMFSQSFTNEANPNSRQDDPPFLFFHFPSPFLDNNSDPSLGFVPQQDEIMGRYTEEDLDGSKMPPKFRLKNKKKRSDDDGAKNPNPRKRTGKTDRHSKIYTANGPRDRRMRLSVQIARKFFDLQDMLGFDKASKTIEWLFSNSKAAIRELTGNLPKMNSNCSHRGKSLSSLDECEVAIKEGKKGIETKGKSETLMGDPNEKKNRKWRKAALYNPRAKESRDKARARARARTREKMIIRSLDKSKQCIELEANTNNLEQLGSLSPFETVYQLHSHSLEKTSPLELASHIEEPRPHSQEHQLATVGIFENFLGTASSSTSQSQSLSHSIFNFQLLPAVSDGVDSHSFLGIRGNWDMEDARINSNYCALTNMFPLTGNVHEQNPISTSDIHFQFQGSHFSCKHMDGNDSYCLN